jgi:hypothetical protein
MIEDIEFNDLNDQWEENQYGDELYCYHFPADPGWEPHVIHIWDWWDVARCPSICIEYKRQGKEFQLRLFFEGDTYHKIIGYRLDVDGSTLFSIEGVNLTQDDFFVRSPDGTFIKGTEEKCIKLINRYWNLKAFL